MPNVLPITNYAPFTASVSLSVAESLGASAGGVTAKTTSHFLSKQAAIFVTGFKSIQGNRSRPSPLHPLPLAQLNVSSAAFSWSETAQSWGGEAKGTKDATSPPKFLLFVIFAMHALVGFFTD